MKIALYILATIGFINVMSIIAFCILAFLTPVTIDRDDELNSYDRMNGANADDEQVNI